MKRTLFILSCLAILLAGVLMLQEEQKEVEHKTSVETDKERPKKDKTFVSQLNEPYSKVLSKPFIYKDFYDEKCFTITQIKDATLVHILKIESDTQLDSFFHSSDKLINLEALEVVDVNLNLETFNQLIIKLEHKKHLKKLVINNCKIKEVPSSIKKLQTLLSLDFSQNNIKSLPNEVCELEQLSYLRIYSSKLSELPENLGQLKNLELLDFAGSKVSSIPKSIGKCLKLVHITANASKVKAIPIEIKYCKNLKYINLAFNQIESIPKEIGALTQLTNLSLDGNQISKLPLEFKNLTKLGLCGLSTNKFSTFPEEVLNLTNLYTLKLYENKLNRIPIEISNLIKLKLLYIDIDKIPNSDIEAVKNKLPDLEIKDVK